ncbi:hypothetical protein Agabi119p4_2311 [Agaricus bisporus var. burnettii]|uniref:Uncharacterized protein n=1 Tax=Agaricus bisporus var. burnettii TaxID=192524 RepID=A0A8H7F928_AGABI|nr:hypothetical protein Agabi119p4_2311 [Agaricus bisporus var. burnettii]
MKFASSCTIETSPLAILLRDPGVVEIRFQPEDLMLQADGIVDLWTLFYGFEIQDRVHLLNKSRAVINTSNNNSSIVFQYSPSPLNQIRTTGRTWTETEKDEDDFKAMLEKELDKIYQFQENKFQICNPIGLVHNWLAGVPFTSAERADSKVDKMSFDHEGREVNGVLEGRIPSNEAGAVVLLIGPI